MSRSATSLLILLPLLGLGCATVLTPGGANVKISEKKPRKRCLERSPVKGGAKELADAEKKIRNLAAEKGANYVFLESKTSTGGKDFELAGTAYYCP